MRPVSDAPAATRSIGETRRELHSTIISRDVAAKIERTYGRKVRMSCCVAALAGSVKSEMNVAGAGDRTRQFNASLTMQPSTKTSRAAATIRFSG
jgi:hypothetical protein